MKSINTPPHACAAIIPPAAPQADLEEEEAPPAPANRFPPSPLSPTPSPKMASNDELIAAVEAQDAVRVHKLLLGGADPNARRKPLTSHWNKAPVTLGPTALMLAMRSGNDDIAQTLLAKKADPLLHDQFNKNAPMTALEFGHADMPALKTIITGLTKKGLEHVDLWGQNLVMYAALAGAVDVVDLILNQDADGSSLTMMVEDGQHPQLDLLALSAKHGQGQVLEKLLKSHRGKFLLEHSTRNTTAYARAGKGKSGRVGERGVSAAILLACASGNWIDSLFDHAAEELDEPDLRGNTPVLYALVFGQDHIAAKLISMGVDVTRKVTGESGPPKLPLLVALESSTISLETITSLVRAGAKTEIPSLDSRRYTSNEINDILMDPSHVIGRGLSDAFQAIDSEDASAKYNMVRVMLAAAFREAPGAALCAFVAIAYNMRKHAERVRLADLDLSEHLVVEANEVGKSVGVVLKTLPEAERERLLRSIPGDNFLRFAAEARCRTMLFSPAIANHIELRWWGEAMHCLSTERAVYQWGGTLPMGRMAWWRLALLMPLVFVANVVLLPVEALVPAFGPWLRAYLKEHCGIDGYDPRESPHCPEGHRGYSPTLGVWWPSLVLFDVPAFKFAMAQLGSLGLLAILIFLAPCFDFNNHQQCFSDKTVWHMIGDSDFVEFLLGKIGVQYDDHLERRLAAASRRLVARHRHGDHPDLGDTDSSGDAEIDLHVPSALTAFPKDVVYLFLIVYTLCVFAAAVRSRPSIATSHTALSGVAALLGAWYLLLDLVPFYGIDNTYDLQPVFLALATFLLWSDIGRAVLLKTFTCGPSVLMLILMFKDVGVFVVLGVTVSIGFGLALFFNGVLAPHFAAMSDDCPMVPGKFATYGFTLVEEFLGIGGVTDQISCAKAKSDTISTVVLELYLVVAVILLLNMLIAMMAETFSEVRAHQEEEYAYLNSQMVISADLDLGNCPAPLSFLRIPSRVLSTGRLVQQSVTSAVNHYSGLKEDSAEPASADYRDYTCPPVDALVETLAAVDFESEKNDLPGLILGVKDDLVASDVIKDSAKRAKIDQRKSGASDVMAFDGFEEEASRMVFHYGDNFQHLPNNPIGRTYLPSGVAENEPKNLPIRPIDEAPDKAKGEEDMTEKQMADKLKTRGLVSYPFAQSMPLSRGREIIEEVGDAYVYERPNGTIGLSQIWPIKVNDAFFKQFTVAYGTNPNPKVFQPQAVGEFKRSIDRLFGEGATRKHPVLFAQNKKRNKLPIFKGNSDALQAFLRASPKVCDDMNIAKLYPGGFVSIISIGGNPAKGEPPKKNNYKNFDFTPGIEYVLYTKQGYESMACIKGYFQFETDCTLGKRLESLELAGMAARDASSALKA